MTIYIVTSGAYSDYSIRAIFADRKKAELYCAMHEREYCAPEIEEWETEDGSIETVATVNEYYSAKFSQKGDLYGEIESRYTLEECDTARVSMCGSRYYCFSDTLYVNVVLPINTPADKVKKIMRDAVAKWRYEHLVEGNANDT